MSDFKVDLAGDSLFKVEFTDDNTFDVTFSDDATLDVQLSDDNPFEVEFSDHGTQGATGPQGNYYVKLYQRAATSPDTPANLTWTPGSGRGTLSGTLDGWALTIPSGTEQLWEVEALFDPATDTNITTWSSVYQAGSQGPTGTKGDTGDAGSKGDKGDLGPRGDKGDTGDTGSAGSQGIKGEPGSTGPKGDQGDAGVKGDKGTTGDGGAAGAKGDKGDVGSTGAGGSKGDKGDAGSAGANTIDFHDDRSDTDHTGISELELDEDTGLEFVTVSSGVIKLQKYVATPAFNISLSSVQGNRSWFNSDATDVANVTAGTDQTITTISSATVNNSSTDIVIDNVDDDVTYPVSATAGTYTLRVSATGTNADSVSQSDSASHSWTVYKDWFWAANESAANSTPGTKGRKQEDLSTHDEVANGHTFITVADGVTFTLSDAFGNIPLPTATDVSLTLNSVSKDYKRYYLGEYVNNDIKITVS